MAEYIDRAKIAAEVKSLSTHLLNEWDSLGVLLLIDRQPAADVAPVVHAHWERDDKIRCSNCGMPTTDLLVEPSAVDYDQATFAVNVFAHPYCGFCGAKMDERSEDNG